MIDRSRESPAEARVPIFWLLWLLVVLSLLLAWYFVHWPINHLRVEEPLVYQDERELEQLLVQWQGRNLLDGQLGQLKAELEELPWIASAAIQFVWPDRLSISLKEQRPVAVWNQDWLISDQGQVFHPGHFEQPLPQLQGPEQRAKDVMQQYLWFSQVLEFSDWQLSEVQLAGRGAWRLTMNWAQAEQAPLPLDIILGTDPSLARLARVRAWMQAMQAQLPRVEVIDARYDNGLAVSYRQPAQDRGDQNE